MVNCLDSLKNTLGLILKAGLQKCMGSFSHFSSSTLGWFVIRIKSANELISMVWAVNRVTKALVGFLEAAEGFPWHIAMGILAAFVATDGMSFFSSNIYQVGPIIGLGFLMGILERTLFVVESDKEHSPEV